MAAVLLGGVYLVVAPPLYTVPSEILMDANNASGQFGDALNSIGLQTTDETSILSQLEILNSESIGLAVVDKLNLVSNPEFNSGGTSPLALASEWVNKGVAAVRGRVLGGHGSPEGSLEQKRRAALSKLQAGFAVKRIGRTYVLELDYTSWSPELAAQISGGYADAYLNDQLNAKYEVTKRASDWLQNRIEELKQKALETDLAVQKFRKDKGLISTGGTDSGGAGGSGSGGSLVSDQRLTGLNASLIAAQADTAQARARYDQIKQIIDKGDTQAIVGDALSNSIITELQTKYLAAAKTENELEARLGADHIQAVRLRETMAAYKKQMFAELSRIGESYLNGYQVAQQREEGIRAQVAQATSETASDNEDLVQLRELERESEAYKTLYSTFLQKYQQSLQQQTFPVPGARVISAAYPPQSPSAPKKPLVMALSAVLGLLVGIGIGAFREFRDRFFRVGEQVRDELGLEFLGIVPLVKQADAVGGEMLKTEAVPGLLHKRHIVSSHVIQNPLSAFAETMRSAKIAADLYIGDQTPKVIGIVSALPNEGKTTVSTNFAELLASQGARTLLIDADLRNPGLTRALARHAEAGVVEAILERRPLAGLLLHNPETGLALLPAVLKHRMPHTADMLSSPGMAALLKEAGEMFDYIVVDLPPLGPVVDARAVAPRIDAFIYVVEWGKTARAVVKSIIRQEPRVFDKCVGVVLNKTDQDQMKLYRAYGSSEYYYSRYSAYYREEN